MKLFKFFTVHVILLDPKKIMSFTVNVMIMCDKEQEERCADVQLLEGSLHWILDPYHVAMRHPCVMGRIEDIT